MINQFFNTQLRPFVDTSGAIWKAQAVAGRGAAGHAPATWRSSSVPAAIGELFFAGGGAQPSVRFDITPQTLDRGAKQVTLELGGQVDQLRPWAAASPTRSPGPGTGMNSARLVFDPAPTGGGRAVRRTVRGRCSGCSIKGTLQEAGSSDRYTLTFHVGDREASFEIRAGSVLNPFAPGMLHDFRCPGL